MTRELSGDLSQASPLVEARGVSVSFGRRSVLEDVNLAVHAGEIVTLVGLNGAGKSTLIRVLLGIVRPSRGEVVRAPGLRIGYSPQHVHRDPILPMTVRRFLTLGASAPRERLETLLAEVGAAGPVQQVYGVLIHDGCGFELPSEAAHPPGLLAAGDFVGDELVGAGDDGFKPAAVLRVIQDGRREAARHEIAFVAP